MPPIRSLSPVANPRASHLNELFTSVVEAGTSQGGLDGIMFEDGAGGTRLNLPPDRMLWIRLTGGGSGSGSQSGSGSGPAYSWEEVIETADGDWVVPADGQFGSDDSFPAYEVNREMDLPADTIGLGRVSSDGSHVRFISSGFAGSGRTFLGLCYRDCSADGGGGTGGGTGGGLVGGAGCQAPATIAVSCNSPYLGLVSATVSHTTGSVWSGTATSSTPFAEGTEAVTITVTCSASSWQATVRSFDNSGNLITQYHGTLTVTAPGVGDGALTQDTGPATGFGNMQFAMNGSGSGGGSGGGSGSTVTPDPCRELTMKWQNADGSICYERIPDCPSDLSECGSGNNNTQLCCLDINPVPMIPTTYSLNPNDFYGGDGDPCPNGVTTIVKHSSLNPLIPVAGMGTSPCVWIGPESDPAACTFSGLTQRGWRMLVDCDPPVGSGSATASVTADFWVRVLAASPNPESRVRHRFTATGLSVSALNSIMTLTHTATLQDLPFTNSAPGSGATITLSPL